MTSRIDTLAIPTGQGRRTRRTPRGRLIDVAPDAIRLHRGDYVARASECNADLLRAQAFRAKCFGLGVSTDQDDFDHRCLHVLIEHSETGALAGCFRLQRLEAEQINDTYAAQYYDVSRLSRFEGRAVEMGRFCIDATCRNPDILRLAWAAVTQYVDRTGIELLFGCSSFAGTEPSAYLDVFALLKAHHLAPKQWSPGVKAPEVFRFAARLRRAPDTRKALAHMPPLLRSYLVMGARVSDHAVIDRQMNTLHVFTAIEVCAIPPARKARLRALI